MIHCVQVAYSFAMMRKHILLSSRMQNRLHAKQTKLITRPP